MAEAEHLPTYLRRATRLRCPRCGESPLFEPLAAVRGPGDWLSTRHGCEGCGLVYARESGYFLIATWGLNYGVAAAVALLAYFLVETWLHPPLTTLLALVVVPTAVVALLFARHAKAYFLAIDRFIDP